MDGSLQARVESGCYPAQHPRAQRVEIALHQVCEQHHKRKAEQGCYVAARNDAIVNLQHIKRARQHQHVDHAAKYRDTNHTPRAFAQPKCYRIVASQHRQEV